MGLTTPYDLHLTCYIIPCNKQCECRHKLVHAYTHTHTCIRGNLVLPHVVKRRWCFHFSRFCVQCAWLPAFMDILLYKHQQDVKSFIYFQSLTSLVLKSIFRLIFMWLGQAHLNNLKVTWIGTLITFQSIPVTPILVIDRVTRRKYVYTRGLEFWRIYK